MRSKSASTAWVSWLMRLFSATRLTTPRLMASWTPCMPVWLVGSVTTAPTRSTGCSSRYFRKFSRAKPGPQTTTGQSSGAEVSSTWRTSP